MQTRYYLEHSSKVSNAGITPIRLGLPVTLHTINDICLCCKGSTEFIPLNAVILREALLADPEKVKAYLGIEVKDILNQPEPVKKESKKK
jgi:hypothetical protein